ncbi:putative membrane-bound dehydrogenase domain-containing protein [Maribacter dokdonensis]|uniref:Putative membrane-bound dehydrogenase domain-containing protein n=1 Tax=Maribacter dokdonensis TaxID=320912 RepID=A0A1H4TQ54_9FLAO|nr:PVC-type heme-binding CxxCH protein [Maribacter dokdonensis]SEC58380.1 putative membrane-bound dehydrogenase domain-containing protein [Maribacter dokdonensis]
MKTYSYPFLFLSLIIFLSACSPMGKEQLDDKPRRIELLFLGHELEHHNSRTYFPILASALTKDGINITYTEKQSDLNEENLRLYDGLIMYGNQEEISHNEEKALLSFVENGNAFIPIHSASFCFKNSNEYIKLVGAQFKSHQTGTFMADIVNKDHPVTKNLAPFKTWDETYVHDKIADDITVLMERVEGDHREPYTWVKEVGEGKVFYTAFGHDDRTWNNKGFQSLIKSGILWAVNKKVKKNWTAFMVNMPTLSYEERANIPNYEKRDPAPKYQLPLSAEASKKLIQVPAGFEVQLFASEPDIINPIAMDWDEQGRLWVIETVDYPNTVRNDNSKGDDKVKILEDTDGDGKADKVTIFAEELNIPTSFTFYGGGIIVSQAPHFIFLKDTDGDDKADVKEILIDGWGTFDTHAGPSNLQYGIDNNLYGVVGYSGFDGNAFGQDLKFNQNVYRFNPKKKTFEVITNTSNNTWGLGITEDNEIFASTANNTHSAFVAIPNKNLKDVKGIGADGSAKIDGHYYMQPITSNVRQVDVFGGFTAAAGHYFYTARAYPEPYWNKIAFVCEPTGGLVHQAKIVNNGSGYAEEDYGNLFASADEWSSPVDAKVGPDGAVWIADWYNFIVQHNPTPNEDRGGYNAENGDGNAYVNPLRDKGHGRIWRVVPKDDDTYEPKQLSKKHPGALLKALSDDNKFWRLTGQRLIVENGYVDLLSGLYELVNDQHVDQIGLNNAALHALWTINGLNAIENNNEALKVVRSALYHKAWAVRKAALQMLPRNTQTDAAILKANTLYDKDPRVQLATLLYFTERPSSTKMGQLMYNLSQDQKVMSDPWLYKALYANAAIHLSGFLNAFHKANPTHEISFEKRVDMSLVNYDDSDWETMELPQYIENAGLDIDGVIWFRREVNIPANMVKGAAISLGPIDDSDITYINGIEVGSMASSYSSNRHYKIPDGVLKPGKNTIAIKVEDTGGEGGIYGNFWQMYIEAGESLVRINGAYKYKVEKSFLDQEEKVTNVFDMVNLLYKYYDNQSNKIEAQENIDQNDAKVIEVKVLKNEMKFNVTRFEVNASEQVELVLQNPDYMQHNLVITKPGKKDIVGKAADKMAADPNAATLNYVPQMGDVLFATPILNPDETYSLKFTAPSKPGEYPYICTFPGHWRIMQGVMIVK